MVNEGVMVVIYDLPFKDAKNRREYVRFRKDLKKLAYRQLQESVYIKHLRNIRYKSAEVNRLQKVIPSEGYILSFGMTMTQYNEITVLKGENLPFETKFSSVMYA